MGVVEFIDKVGEFVLSVCPNHKNVVNEMQPHKRLVRGFLKGIGFKDSHKDINIAVIVFSFRIIPLQKFNTWMKK